MSLTARQGFANYLTTLVSYVISMGAGIFFTPFLVRNLGPASYGLTILSASVLGYFGPLVVTLSMTVTRFITIARQASDTRALDDLLHASTWLTLWAAGLFGGAIIALAFGAPFILGLAPQYHAEATGVFLLFGLSFLIWLLGVPFTALTFSANRLDNNNYAQIIQNVVRVGTAFLLIAFVAKKSWFVGLGAVAGSLVCLWTLVSGALSHAPLRAFIPRRCGPELIAELGKTASAVLVSQAGSIMLLGTELLLVNYMASQANAGRYAAAIQIPNLVRSAMTSIAAIFAPAIITHYARGELRQAARITIRSMRLLGAMTALPAGFLFAMGPNTLRIWLGPSFAPFTPVLLADIAGGLFFVTALPLYEAVLAANRVAWPGALRIVVAAGYMLLAVALFRLTNLGALSVAFALAGALILPELLAMVPYTARVTSVPPHGFWMEFAIALVAAGASYGITLVLMHFMHPTSFFMLFVASCCDALIYIPVCAGILFRNETAEWIGRGLGRRH